MREKKSWYRHIDHSYTSSDSSPLHIFLLYPPVLPFPHNLLPILSPFTYFSPPPPLHVLLLVPLPSHTSLRLLPPSLPDSPNPSLSFYINYIRCCTFHCTTQLVLSSIQGWIKYITSINTIKEKYFVSRFFG